MSEEKDISILNQERFVQQMAEICRLRARVAELERERDELKDLLERYAAKGTA